jgi:AraC-like DNA-binding protein
MSLIIDTSEVDPAERFAMWAEESSRVFFPLSISPVISEPFSGTVHGRELGPVNLYWLAAGPSQVARTHHTIGAADPEAFLLGFERRGRTRLEQEGRSCALTQGAIFGWQTSAPFVIRNETDFEMFVLCLPMSLLRPYTDRVRARTGLRVDHGMATSIVAPFLAAMSDRTDETYLDAGGADLGETIVDLVRSVFVAPDGGISPNRWSETLLPRITSYVYKHLGDPDLTPATIAAAHFISTRSLHRMWEERGVSLAEWIRELRLSRCRRDLADPALADESIATIAARWGMRNPAHFSRVYRSTFGRSPSEQRPRRRAG